MVSLTVYKNVKRGIVLPSKIYFIKSILTKGNHNFTILTNFTILYYLKQLLQYSLGKVYFFILQYSFCFLLHHGGIQIWAESDIFKYCRLWYSIWFPTHRASPVCLFNNGLSIFCSLWALQWYVILILYCCSCCSNLDIQQSHIHTEIIVHTYTNTPSSFLSLQWYDSSICC